MKRTIIYLLFSLLLVSNTPYKTFAQQEAPADGSTTPLSGNASAASHFENVSVNYYTGMPSISIPLFNWSDQNGLSVGVTLDYNPGGIRVNEGPSTAGLGWNVNVGGSIVRTVRGMPDDYPLKGFLYAPPVPLDYVADGTKYYHDSLDAQQDIFQFNFNGRSGKFFIGKNKKIVTVPLSKLRIGYTTIGDSTITSFYIITEEGIKYEFKETETAMTSTTGFSSGFDSHIYINAWNLSSMSSMFGKDTIRFVYRGLSQSVGAGATLTGYLISGGSDSVIHKYASVSAHQSVLSKKIAKILLPDNKVVSFQYDPNVKYEKYDFGLNNIHVSDSVFRYGYQLVWATTDTTERSFLTGLRYYTKKYIMPGYKFYYNNPHFHDFGGDADSLGNKYDYWGFYNGAANDTNRIPNVDGIYHLGAKRNPSKTAVLASTLSYIVDPSGGKTYYKFEINDAYRPFNTVPKYSRLNAKFNSSNNIHINHVSNNTDSFSLSAQMNFLFGDVIPFSDEANIICTITNADSSVVYATDTVSLTHLFYYHQPVSFSVSNLQNGDYVFKTRLEVGSSVNCHALWVQLKWTNQQPTDSLNFLVGGLRIQQVLHYDPVTNRTDTISTYKYVLPNGRSSGFLGVAPSYNHLYRETKIVGASIYDNSYEAISSNPVNNLSYTQGNPVGYSRVEVIKGSLKNNLGKEVYEFTTLNDAGLSVHPQFFPYAPYMQEDWLLGLNKKVSVYDSSGRLMQETVNIYHTESYSYTDSNYRSVKLGLVSTLIDDDEIKETYDGQYYFPQSGRADLISSTQTFYHTDNSQQVKTQQVQYDSNYNAVKMISGYDKSRSLSLERRMYYPYHYTIGGMIGKLRDSSIYTVVSTEDWITGDSNPRMVAASVTDFQQLPNGNIKPSGIYALQSRAPLPMASIDTFDAGHLVRNSAWFKKQQEFISFDSLGNIVEVRNAISGQSNSVIMDYNGRFPVAKISNARIRDLAYTSFEADGSGHWKIGSAQRVDTNAITGKRSYNLSNGAITKGGLDNTLSFIISYWKKGSGSVSISGAADITLVAEQRGWKLYTQTISSTDTVTVTGTGIIDELRLYPKDANMATSTFEPSIGVTSSCDANNTINYTEYDSANRVIVLRDKDYNILKKFEYSDSLIIRNLNSYVTIYMSDYNFDATTNSVKRACFKYPYYSGRIMGDAIPTDSILECPKNPDAGQGLAPDE